MPAHSAPHPHHGCSLAVGPQAWDTGSSRLCPHPSRAAGLSGLGHTPEPGQGPRSLGLISGVWTPQPLAETRTPKPRARAAKLPWWF